ncbi:MAG: hypothetical protein KJ556_21350 [Gammaproteobacteria bacterium]|nr:hypothetical protein [Gammaproteobacteria bacterium]
MKKLLTIAIFAVILGFSLNSFSQPVEELAPPTPAPAEEGVIEVGNNIPTDAPPPSIAPVEVEAVNPEVVPDETAKAATDEVPVTEIRGFVEALKSGEYRLAAGLFILILVWLARRFVPFLKGRSKSLPLIALGLSLAGLIAAGLVAGSSPVDILIEAILLSTSAGGLWSLSQSVRAVYPSETKTEQEGTQ